MSVVEIILIGIALAMDAFAVTIANCTIYKNTLNAKKEWAMPLCFAVFQFLMPVLGFYLGSIVSDWISGVSKYLTAAIFFFLSAKIVFDNVKEMKEREEAQTKGPFSYKILLLQGLATSIDALAIGVTFAMSLNFNVYLASLIIGVTTFVIVSIALLFGKYLGKLFGKYAQWVGAAILLGLEIKTLVEALI